MRSLVPCYQNERYLIWNITDLRVRMLNLIFLCVCLAETIDHIGRVSNQMCPGKIVQVDSKLRFKSPGQWRLGLIELSFQNRNDKDFVSNTSLDQLGHAKDNNQVEVVYFRRGQDSLVECGIMKATIHYRFNQPAYSINGKIYRKYELWTKEKGKE